MVKYSKQNSLPSSITPPCDMDAVIHPLCDMDAIIHPLCNMYAVIHPLCDMGSLSLLLSLITHTKSYISYLNI